MYGVVALPQALNKNKSPGFCEVEELCIPNFRLIRFAQPNVR